MKLRTLLSAGALLLAIAIPATGSAQRYRSYSGHGRSTFNQRSYHPYPRRTVVPGYRYFNSGTPYRSGGVTFYFGNGGGYYGNGYGGYYGSPNYVYPSYPGYRVYGFRNYGNRYHR